MFPILTTRIGEKTDPQDHKPAPDFQGVISVHPADLPLLAFLYHIIPKERRKAGVSGWWGLFFGGGRDMILLLHKSILSLIGRRFTYGKNALSALLSLWAARICVAAMEFCVFRARLLHCGHALFIFPEEHVVRNKNRKRGMGK